MIEPMNLTNIDHSSKEGKLLMMALAILTSIDIEDIKSVKWGGKVHPDTALEQVVDLANKVYYENEWKIEREIIKRDNKINSIING